MKEYPRLLTLVKKGDKNQWDIGDELITLCGPPCEGAGKKDDSQQRFAEMSEYLAAEGYKYKPVTLAGLRITSHNFNFAERKIDLAWGVYRKAGTPEFLKAVIAGAPKGTRITQDFVEKVRSQILEEQRQERKEKEAEAKAEREAAEQEEVQAKEKEKSAKTKQEKEQAKTGREAAKTKTEKAKEKEQSVKTAPNKKAQPPAADEVPILVIRADFLGDAA